MIAFFFCHGAPCLCAVRGVRAHSTHSTIPPNTHPNTPTTTPITTPITTPPHRRQHNKPRPPHTADVPPWLDANQNTHNNYNFKNSNKQQQQRWGAKVGAREPSMGKRTPSVGTRESSTSTSSSNNSHGGTTQSLQMCLLHCRMPSRVVLLLWQKHNAKATLLRRHCSNCDEIVTLGHAHATVKYTKTHGPLLFFVLFTKEGNERGAICFLRRAPFLPCFVLVQNDIVTNGHHTLISSGVVFYSNIRTHSSTCDTFSSRQIINTIHPIARSILRIGTITHMCHTNTPTHQQCNIITPTHAYQAMCVASQQPARKKDLETPDIPEKDLV